MKIVRLIIEENRNNIWERIFSLVLPGIPGSSLILSALDLHLPHVLSTATMKRFVFLILEAANVLQHEGMIGQIYGKWNRRTYLFINV